MKTDHLLLVAAIVVFVAFVGFGILIPIIPLYADRFGANEFQIGLLIAVYALMQFLSNPILGRLSDSYGRRPLLLATIAGNIGAYILLGIAGNLLMLFIGRIISGIMGGNIAVAQAYIANAVDADERARGFGIVGASIGMGFVFGPALGGIFSSESSVAFARVQLPWIASLITRYSLPCFITAMLAAVNFWIAFLFLPRVTPEPSDEATNGSSLRRLLTNRVLLGLVISYSVRSFAYTSMTSINYDQIDLFENWSVRCNPFCRE